MKNYFNRIIFQKIKIKERILWTAILLCLLFVALTTGTVIHTSGNTTQNRKLPIYSVETKEKVVALTFNCAWNIDDLDCILDILQKNDIIASFFMTGEWVDKYPQAVKKIQKAGHDIASHGDAHKHMNSLSKEECREEIYKIHKKVFELTGIEMKLFRPPYGEYNDTVISVAEDMDYYPIQWSVDSLDWKNYGSDQMIQQVVEHKDLQNGAIILMHNGTKYTAEALQGIIDGLRNQGYGFVSVSELIYQQDYRIDHNGRQHFQGETK